MNNERSPRGERGTVTAESALVLPLVAIFALTLVWMVTVVISQIQVVDAARDAARALARGESSSVAQAQAARTAPDGARIEVSSSDDADAVTVSVSAETAAPRWLLVPLPSVTVESRATVQVESDALSGPADAIH